MSHKRLSQLLFSTMVERDASFLWTLKLGSYEKLRECQRQPCPKCGMSRKYFCYTCFLPIGIERDQLPQFKLPVYVDVVRHPKEGEGRSSSAQAKVLCPIEVTIYDYPHVPFYGDTSKVVLLFPSESAVTPDQLPVTGPGCAASIERALFIDCTWAQTKRILQDERLKGLKHIKLDNLQTTYWRPQPKKADTCLATIEAIYWFLCQLHPGLGKGPYEGQYDNLLYFYNFQHSLVTAAAKQMQKDTQDTLAGDNPSKQQQPNERDVHDLPEAP